jgi:hypothetical protein
MSPWSEGKNGAADGAGLDAAIADPCDRQPMAHIAAAEALLGRDQHCMKYPRARRQGRPETPTAASA